MSNTRLAVGVDISSVVYGRGVSRYTTNLVRCLGQQPDVAVHLYGSSLRQKSKLTNLVSELKPAASHIQSLPPRALSWLWSHTTLNSVRSFWPRLQVFHSWDWVQPPDEDLPLVSTIHDLAMLKFPETAHPEILAHHQRAWKTLKARRAHIIAVSRATKLDIMEYLDIPSEQITVIHEALPQEVVAASQSITEEVEAAVVHRLKLDRPYILAVGTREPRKNMDRLIKAWLPLAKEYQLLIAGAAGWDDSDKWLAESKGQLRLLGKVTDQELAVLYSQAEAFAYPSLYEGFGLPILEAFHHGTPVVTSNVSSLPEVAGNAAVLVNPESVESIRDGLKAILSESPTAQQRRAQQMIVRLHLFDWNRVALETTRVYHQAAGGR